MCGPTELTALVVARIDTRLVRVRLAAPAHTPLGTMRERAALLVRIVRTDGASGWGEVFSNWPPGGSRHRRRLIRDVLAPAIEGRGFDSPDAMGAALERASHRLRLQCDEPGPFDQCIAGLSMAGWDAIATGEGLRLADVLRRQIGAGAGAGADAVPVYTSGIGPARLVETITAWRARGVRAFKTMVGAAWRDALPALAAARDAHGDAIDLMLDANQAWTLDEALAAVRALHPFGLRWIEEPLPVDAPVDDWFRVADATDIALAGGENLRGDAAFDAAIGAGALRVIQPDPIKWGGPARVAEVGRRARAAGLRFCPHHLGGPVGLRACAHVLAAVGGDGLLETDVNGHLLGDAAGLPLRLDDAGRLPLAPLGPRSAGERAHAR